jgi:hypothetical protein
MLEGFARLRVAEQRVRDGLVAPHIHVQRASESAPLHAGPSTPSAARHAFTPNASSSRGRWARWAFGLLGLLLLASALALKLWR